MYVPNVLFFRKKVDVLVIIDIICTSWNKKCAVTLILLSTGNECMPVRLSMLILYVIHS